MWFVRSTYAGYNPSDIHGGVGKRVAATLPGAGVQNNRKCDVNGGSIKQGLSILLNEQNNYLNQYNFSNGS